MSKLDIINDELARRKESSKSLEEARQPLIDAIEQFNKLDELYRLDEKNSREKLECLYLENRHFTGKWPIVYTSAQTEKEPFFGGATDAECNPYFPITKVQDETSDGITPLEAPPTKTGDFQRDRNFSPTEDVARGAALPQLQNFPDISGEPLPQGWPGPQENGPAYCSGETPAGSGTDEATCIANGGTWNDPGDPIPDPVWNGPDTAPALLRVPLQAWRDDMILIRDDVCDDAAEVAYWQGLIDDCDTVLAEIASDAVFVRATGDSDPAAWGQTQPFTGATEAARARLETAADTGVADHVAMRTDFLSKESDTEEQVFFGIIKLRLHQANGSFSKLKAAKKQKITNESLIKDNNEAIESLNLLKVKSS